MTKNETFSYVQKFNGVKCEDLIRVPEISHYNHNYYKTDDGYLLYAECDDDDYSAWYLCSKPNEFIVCFGESFISCDNVINVYDDIRYMHFYNVEK